MRGSIILPGDMCHADFHGQEARMRAGSIGLRTSGGLIRRHMVRMPQVSTVVRGRSGVTDNFGLRKRSWSVETKRHVSPSLAIAWMIDMHI